MPTITVYATKEASVNEVAPTTNYSGNNYLNVGDDYFDPGQNYRTWLGFILSSIPAGSQIDSAVLTILPFFAGSFGYTGGNMNVQKCTDNSWTQAGITWNNAPNGSVLAEKFGIHVVGSDTAKSFTVTGQVQDALASGGISYRVKASVEDNDTEALLSCSVYTATLCAKIVITYSTTAVVEGFIDIPVTEDGYITGTYDGGSVGVTVYKAGNTLSLGMTSSSGFLVDQLFLLFNTSASNLTALGLPSGATITSHAWRLYCSQAFNTLAVGLIQYFRGWAGELGTSIGLEDWDCPGMSTPGTRTFNDTGWFEYSLVTINNGITAIGLVPGNWTSASSYAIFHSSRNSSGNAPVLRIYYSYTPSAGEEYTLGINETLVIVGNIIKKPKRNLVENAIITGFIIRGRIFTESILITGTIAKLIHRYISNLLSLVDSIYRKITRIFINTASITPAIIAKPARILSEVVSLVDYAPIRLNRVLNDIIGLTDTIIRRAVKSFLNSLSITGTINGVVRRILSEIIVVSEILVKRIRRVMSEILSISIIILRGLIKLITETVTITENFIKRRIKIKIFSEIITLIDNISKKAFKVLFESISFVEHLVRRLNGMIILWTKKAKNIDDWEKQDKDF